MSKNITIIDPQYKEWIKELSQRYRRSQIKAAVKVNSEMLKICHKLWQISKSEIRPQSQRLPRLRMQ